MQTVIKRKIREKYLNPKTGLKSKDLFVKENPNYDPQLVNEVINEEPINQIYYNKKKQYAKITAPPYTWQADLLFLEPENLYKHHNSGYHILCNFIEINSRYAISYPLKNKTKSTVENVLKEFVKNNQCIAIEFDNGPEFNNNLVKDFLESKQIRYYFYDKAKGQKFNLMMVERFNRTLRDKINKYLIAHDTEKFIDVLPDLLSNYNSTKHSVTHKRPNEIINKPEILQKIHETTLEFNVPVITELANIETDDSVRVKNAKKFAKGNKYSLTTHKVKDVDGYHIKADNNKNYNINDVIKVDSGTKKNLENKNSRLKNSVKEKLVNRRLKREGLF